MKNIAFWRSVCGCTLGAWSALAATVYCIIAQPMASAPIWARVGVSVAIVLTAAVTGKLLALATARAFVFALER